MATSWNWIEELITEHFYHLNWNHRFSEGEPEDFELYFIVKIEIWKWGVFCQKCGWCSNGKFWTFAMNTITVVIRHSWIKILVTQKVVFMSNQLFCSIIFVAQMRQKRRPKWTISKSTNSEKEQNGSSNSTQEIQMQKSSLIYVTVKKH